MAMDFETTKSVLSQFFEDVDEWENNNPLGVSESKTNQSASAGENSPWSHLEMLGFGDLLPEIPILLGMQSLIQHMDIPQLLHGGDTASTNPMGTMVPMLVTEPDISHNLQPQTELDLQIPLSLLANENEYGDKMVQTNSDFFSTVNRQTEAMYSINVQQQNGAPLSNPFVPFDLSSLGMQSLIQHMDIPQLLQVDIASTNQTGTMVPTLFTELDSNLQPREELDLQIPLSLLANENEYGDKMVETNSYFFSTVDRQTEPMIHSQQHNCAPLSDPLSDRYSTQSTERNYETTIGDEVRFPFDLSSPEVQSVMHTILENSQLLQVDVASANQTGTMAPTLATELDSNLQPRKELDLQIHLSLLANENEYGDKGVQNNSDFFSTVDRQTEPMIHSQQHNCAPLSDPLSDRYSTQSTEGSYGTIICDEIIVPFDLSSPGVQSLVQLNSSQQPIVEIPQIVQVIDSGLTDQTTVPTLLTEHINTSNEPETEWTMKMKFFLCRKCGNAYTTSKSLKRHDERIHSLAKCSFCDYKTQKSYTLRKHVRRFHGLV
uniref:C2H2-type domain-containing protein n=1 Tax=Daphnia galeata TaxID=27404 RepID=A0A8J2WGV8_9CRUS|nr:unnamed protein product [Daphnia galeata]